MTYVNSECDLETLRSMVSDSFKDLNGFRPRSEVYWASLTTVKACELELDSLSSAWADEKAAKAAEYEGMIQSALYYGAKDRAQAKRWIKEL